ncbi:MAG TPA: hemolysin family protein [Gemmatimonadaceae bacterium]|nr:hemolysin family protein [Gemmatimonadaceae bacterium]
MLGRLAFIVVLLVLNGYFVAAEFALVRSRRTRLQAMVRSGDPIARFALSASGNLARVLSTSQLGITLASLGLGWAAQSSFGEAFEAVFSRLPFPVEGSLRVSIGAIVALLVVSFFHVVFGELAPKAAALLHPEQFAKWLAPPLLAFAWIASPFTWVLNRSAMLVLHAFGQRVNVAREPVHSPDEIRMLVEQSEEQGALEPADAEMLGAVLEFSEKNAREVMTPRTDIVAMPATASLDDALETVEESRFSRYPVYDESIDQVVGMVHVKDLLGVLHEQLDRFTVRDVMRSIHVVPGSREVEAVLTDFKRLKEHMAIVLDEYGGTAGLVTMEDLLEEIVGEILDEYDETTEEPIPRAVAGETRIPGAMSIRELNERYKLTVPEDDYTTIGGHVFGALGRLPVVGDHLSGGGATFEVRAMDGRRIETLAMKVENPVAS